MKTEIWASRPFWRGESPKEPINLLSVEAELGLQVCVGEEKQVGLCVRQGNILDAGP